MAKENKSAAANKPAAARAGAETDWDDSTTNASRSSAPESKVTPLPASSDVPGVAEGIAESAAPATLLKLPDPKLEEDEGDGGPLPTEDSFEFPNDLKKSFDLLHEATALPTSTNRERKVRAIALAAVRKHVFALQQGTPLVTMGATEIAKAAPTHDTLHRHKLEMIARHMPEVKQLLEEYDALKRKNADLNELLKKA